MNENGFPHLTLLGRSVAMSREFGLCVETSIYQSNVTGLHVLEQIQHGRHGTSTNTVTLSPGLMAEFLPLLARIAAGDEAG
jgi:hypothetical protein